MTELTQNYLYDSNELMQEKTSTKEVLLIVVFSTIASVSAIFGLFMFFHL